MYNRRHDTDESPDLATALAATECGATVWFLVARTSPAEPLTTALTPLVVVVADATKEARIKIATAN